MCTDLMYSSFQVLKKYLRYYYTASNGKGHGIHSPFVFDFVINVLNNKSKVDRCDEIEKVRTLLLRNKTLIDVEDFGAGSGVMKSKKRAVKRIAASSLKSKKYAILLARIAKYYKPHIILELGTSLGISTAYIASSNPASIVYTLEGAENISNIAQRNFDKIGLQNIQLIKGDFETTLPALLSKLIKIDLTFIDGNHRKIPTLDYFSQILAISTDQTILIFDDVHWSAEMEAAWKQIQQHPAVTLTIDLFFLGFVFLRKDFKIKQHFAIRF